MRRATGKWPCSCWSETPGWKWWRQEVFQEAMILSWSFLFLILFASKNFTFVEVKCMHDKIHLLRMFNSMTWQMYTVITISTIKIQCFYRHRVVLIYLFAITFYSYPAPWQSFWTFAFLRASHEWIYIHMCMCVFPPHFILFLDFWVCPVPHCLDFCSLLECLEI